MGKYRPAVILTLALTVFLASCKGTSDDPVTPGPGPGPETKSWVVSTIAGYGIASGEGGNPDNDDATEATFNSPAGIAVDSSGNLYVADSGNNRIRKIAISSTGVVGAVSTLAGTGTAGFADTAAAGADPAVNPAVVATFNGPQGIAVDSSGENLYVAGTFSHIIRKVVISTGAVSTIAGTAGTSGSANNDVATAATFNGPTGVAVDSSGNLYVADKDNHLIRKIAISSTGVVGAVSTFAGTGSGKETYKDRFSFPVGVAVDSSDNLYVADKANNRIRKIIISTKVGSTLA